MCNTLKISLPLTYQIKLNTMKANRSDYKQSCWTTQHSCSDDLL